jgi:hypothetical protein
MTSSVNNAATVPPIPSSTLTEEESNFLRFLNLILKIAPEAVRAYFDAVHPPATLQNDFMIFSIRLWNCFDSGVFFSQFISTLYLDIEYSIDYFLLHSL